MQAITTIGLDIAKSVLSIGGKPDSSPTASMRIAREIPHWQWTWVVHFIPRVIRDAIL